MRSMSRALNVPQNIAAVLTAVAIVTAPTQAQAQAAGPWGGTGTGKAAGHYADVNGIRLYYEIHGAGRPLILLHGGLGAIEMFGQTSRLSQRIAR